MPTAKKSQLVEECNQGDRQSCVALGRANASDAEERFQLIRNLLLFLLGSASLAFATMIVVFALVPSLFDGFFGIFWANGTGNELLPSLWGWVSIGVFGGTLGLSIILAYLRKNRISYVLIVLAGVALEMILYGIAIKTV